MAAVTLDELAEIERRLALRMIEVFGLDTSAVALDMTNFATYIDSANTRVDIAQRGKAKQKRSDLRLVGLGLAVTRDGGVPPLSHAYPGNKPDVTQFPTMLAELSARHRMVAATRGAGSGGEMTVVFDAGQNSKHNFALLDDSGLHFVGSIPHTECPDLLARPHHRAAAGR
jgi:transposase